MLDHIIQGRELSTISYLIISGGVYATTTQRYVSCLVLNAWLRGSIGGDFNANLSSIMHGA